MESFIMREEYILRSIVLWFLIIYLLTYFKAKKEANIIKVPNFISLLFGSPIGAGFLPIFTLLCGIANMISFIVGLACYFIIDESLGGTIYIYMWASLTLIVSII
jgi:hypothetical protein